jgi:hypothetical protein
MATSLAFGVLFATMVTLLVVPSGYMVLEDLKSFMTRLFGLTGNDPAHQNDTDDATRDGQQVPVLKVDNIKVDQVITD